MIRPHLIGARSFITWLVGLLFVVACSDPFQVSDSLGERPKRKTKWGSIGVSSYDDRIDRLVNVHRIG